MTPPDDDDAIDWNTATNTIDWNKPTPMHAPEAQAARVSSPEIFDDPALHDKSQRKNSTQRFNTKNNSHFKDNMPETCRLDISTNEIYPAVNVMSANLDTHNEDFSGTSRLPTPKAHDVSQHYQSTAISSSAWNGDDQEMSVVKCNPSFVSLNHYRRRNVIISISFGLLLVVPIVVLASIGFFSNDSMTSVSKPTNNVGNGTDGDDIATTSAPTASPTASPVATPTLNPTSSPTLKPTASPIANATEPSTVTYRPGELTVQENGMILSKGLKSRLLAKTGENVTNHNGETSDIPFHIRPDGAATFPVTEDYGSNKGGWVYVSNSEGQEQGSGGVGAVMFDKDGNVINYKRLLGNTTMNCSGGKT